MKKLLLFALMVGLAVCISYWVDPETEEPDIPEDDSDLKSDEEEE